MGDLDGFQTRVGLWGGSVFPQATNVTITCHLRDEVKEIFAAMRDGAEGTVAEEAADCLLLLLHLAHRNGFSLMDAALGKYLVNERRTWETEPNERGYFKHTEEAPAARAGGKGGEG